MQEVCVVGRYWVSCGRGGMTVVFRAMHDQIFFYFTSYFQTLGFILVSATDASTDVVWWRREVLFCASPG